MFALRFQYSKPVSPFFISVESILLHGGDLQQLCWLGLQWSFLGQSPPLGQWLRQLFPRLTLETSKLDTNTPESICLLDLEVGRGDLGGYVADWSLAVFLMFYTFEFFRCFKYLVIHTRRLVCVCVWVCKDLLTQDRESVV